MEHNMRDPLEDLVADGTLNIRPFVHYHEPVVVTVDLDQLAETLTNKLVAIFQYELRLTSRYPGCLADDTLMMVNFLIGQTYNKLRRTLKWYHPTMIASRMTTRCPIYAKIEFPEWLSLTLSSIGPCRILDGPQDTLVVYATAADRSQNWGRKNPVSFNVSSCERLTTTLRYIGVRMAPFDFSREAGSYFPTLSLARYDGAWTVFGHVHHSHYENEDLARLALVANEAGSTPFEPVGMRVGYVDDEATLTALAAVAPPPDVPAGQTVDSDGVPVGHVYRVNYLGIQPAVGAKPRGMYVIGRGMQGAYQFVFANQVLPMDMMLMLKYRIMRTTST